MRRFGQLRQILPMLDRRPDPVDLLGEVILVARRDWLDWFVGNLPPAAACRYEELVRHDPCHCCQLQILRPSTEEKSWRIALVVHAAAVSAVLNEEM